MGVMTSFYSQPHELQGSNVGQKERLCAVGVGVFVCSDRLVGHHSMTSKKKLNPVAAFFVSVFWPPVEINGKTCILRPSRRLGLKRRLLFDIS